VFSVNWDAWREVGMAVNTPVSGALQVTRDLSLKVGIAPGEGIEAFHRILGAGLTQVMVFTMDIRHDLLKMRLGRSKGATVDNTGETPAEAALAAAPGPGGDLERTVAEVWERILGRKGIAAGDNFFELGGDSLTALQVIALLKSRLGREVSVVTFYEAPTVALLARALRNGSEETPVAATEVEERAGTRLEMMQRRREKRAA
jgi:hypothetical protein